MDLALATNLVLHIETHSIPNGALREAVHGWLRDHNAQANPAFVAAMEQGASNPITIVVRNAEQLIVGGLVGETLFSWLRIQIVAVCPSVRRGGVGSRLMQEAEREARLRECVSAYVDTMSYQSPDFYRRVGYVEVGQIPNWDSHGHTKHYFTKQL